jgi:hypothetical protein
MAFTSNFQALAFSSAIVFGVIDHLLAMCTDPRPVIGSVRLVCKSWNNSILDCSKVWSRVYLSLQTPSSISIAGWNSFLERRSAGNAPLDITLELTWPKDSCYRARNAHIHYCWLQVYYQLLRQQVVSRFLHLTILGHFGILRHVSSFTNVADKLVKLHLHRGPGTLNLNFLYFDLDTISLPGLLALTVTSQNLYSLPSFDLPRLRRLTLVDLSVFSFSPFASPNLIHLCFINCAFEDNGENVFFFHDYNTPGECLAYQNLQNLAFKRCAFGFYQPSLFLIKYWQNRVFSGRLALQQCTSLFANADHIEHRFLLHNLDSNDCWEISRWMQQTAETVQNQIR